MGRKCLENLSDALALTTRVDSVECPPTKADTVFANALINIFGGENVRVDGAETQTGCPWLKLSVALRRTRDEPKSVSSGKVSGQRFEPKRAKPFL
jgi:hypothetical protein